MLNQALALYQATKIQGVIMNLALVSIFIVALFSCAPLPANVSDQAYPQTELTAQVDELFTEWDTEDSPGAAIGIF